MCQDAGSAEDNERIVKETVEKLGGIDIIIANAGWTRFSNFKDLNALSHEEWNKVSLPSICTGVLTFNKCWACNVMCHLQLMQAAGPIFNSNTDGGVYLISSSIAVSISKLPNEADLERVAHAVVAVWLIR